MVTLLKLGCGSHRILQCIVGSGSPGVSEWIEGFGSSGVILTFADFVVWQCSVAFGAFGCHCGQWVV